MVLRWLHELWVRKPTMPQKKGWFFMILTGCWNNYCRTLCPMQMGNGLLRSDRGGMYASALPAECQRI